MWTSRTLLTSLSLSLCLWYRVSDALSFAPATTARSTTTTKDLSLVIATANGDEIHHHHDEEEDEDEGVRDRRGGRRRRRRMAVILNANARRVTPRAIAVAAEIAGEEHVFVTSSVEDARAAARVVVDRGYDVVVPAGGDGTLSSVVEAVARECARRTSSTSGDDDDDDDDERRRRRRRLPRFAYLPLGTGNGMARSVGPPPSRRVVSRTLRALKERLDDDDDDGRDLPTIPYPVMRITTAPERSDAGDDDDRTSTTTSAACFFAGAGFDSLMLNDYNVVKRWSRNKPGLGFLRSVTGYAVAMVVRTLPQCLLFGRHQLTIRVTVPDDDDDDDETYWIDHRRGDAAVRVVADDRSSSSSSSSSLFPDPIPPGRALLFEGTAGIVAAGTSPYYGGGLRLFPFARVVPPTGGEDDDDRGGTMHLRLGRIGPLRGLTRLPAIFHGSYRNHDGRSCLDFVGRDFEIESATPCFVQHSGEASERPVRRFRLETTTRRTTTTTTRGRTTSDDEDETGVGVVEFVDLFPPRPVIDY